MPVPPGPYRSKNLLVASESITEFAIIHIIVYSSVVLRKSTDKYLNSLSGPSAVHISGNLSKAHGITQKLFTLLSIDLCTDATFATLCKTI